MSYAHMDHADWMERNNTAANRIYGGRKRWRRLPEKLSLFQAQVTDILGMVGGGIYNAPIALNTIDWTYGYDGVSVIWKRELSTFDFNALTLLVLLCHEARIRCTVEPGGPRMLRLTFFPRQAEGSTPQRHPNIDEAVEAFRRYLPEGHRIFEARPAPSPMEIAVEAEGAPQS